MKSSMPCNLLVGLGILLSVEAVHGDQAIAVAFVRLLTDPQAFEGETIQTYGFLSGGPNLRLYLTSDHAAGFDATSSIAVSDTDEGEIGQSECHQAYVSITGDIELVNRYPVLDNIESVFSPEDGKYCWKRAK